jgi:ABC-type phosphate transport system substrate-binding protein
MRRILLLLFTIGVMALYFGRRAQADPTPAFKVVVNARVTGKGIPRSVLAQIYLGKIKRWGDGSPIVAVDQSSTSVVRESFSRAVLDMPVDAVRQYWMGAMMTSNSRPPVARQSDNDVIAFVASEPGAIGYVSEAAVVPDTVRSVAVQ